MAAVGPGGRKLAELMSNHVFDDIYGHVFPAIVNGDGVTHHVGENGGSTGPGFQHFFLVGFILYYLCLKVGCKNNEIKILIIFYEKNIKSVFKKTNVKLIF